MRLREHHCISPAIPALAGHNPNDAIDDGIRNGWFPSVEIRESGVRCLHAYTQLSVCTDKVSTLQGKVTIQDRSEGVTSEYETFVEGRPNSHNEEKCHICVNNAALREEELQQRVQANRARAEQADKLPRHEDYEEDFAMADLARNDSRYGSDDEDTYEAKCSGIQDIIFTGEVRVFTCICFFLLVILTNMAFHLDFSPYSNFIQRPILHMEWPGEISRFSDACGLGTASSRWCEFL